jgi:hypothetical protein
VTSGVTGKTGVAVALFFRLASNSSARSARSSCSSPWMDISHNGAIPGSAQGIHKQEEKDIKPNTKPLNRVPRMSLRPCSSVSLADSIDSLQVHVYVFIISISSASARK